MNRRIALIFLALLLTVSTQAQKRISREYQNVSFSDALSQLAEQQTDYAIMFLYDELEDFRITTAVNRKTLPDAIQQMIGFYPIRMIVDTSNPKEKKIFVECTHKTDRHLTGTIIDEQGQPVAYANVAILNPADSTLLSGGVSNESGYFAIPYEQPTVLARISYVGYKTVYKFCSQSEVGTIRIYPDNYTLKGVTVKGYKPTMKMNSGGIEIEVQNTVFAKLGDANDVLAQLPLILKKEDEYTVIGHGTPLIYINNRLMRDPKELEELKSSSIKNIKIELNPGSRYSAEVGSVIKITTLRPVGEGLGGSLSSYYKRNNKNAFSELVSLNYRHQGLDVFFDGQYNDKQREDEQHDCFIFSFNGNPIQASKSGVIGSRAIRVLNLTTGLSYYFSEKQQAGIRYKYNSTLTATNYLDFHVDYKEGDATTEYDSHQIIKQPIIRNHQLNAFYQNEFSDNWQLNIDATYVDNRRKAESQQQEDRPGIPSEVGYVSDRKSRLWALKAWNTHRLWGGSIEWGFEATDTRHDQDYLMLNDEVAEYIPSTVSLSKQKAQSLFASYSYSQGAFSTNIGLRYEHLDFDYQTNGIPNDEASKAYNNFFPSLSLSYQKNQSSLSLGYRTIVRRPSYDQLRSEVQYNNSYNADKGNPELLPTYVHHISLTMRHGDFILDASYNIDKNVILFYYLPVTTHPMAIGSFMNHDMQDYDMTLVYSPTIGIWRPSFAVGLMGQVLHVSGISHSGIGLMYQWQNLITLPGNWMITCNLDGTSAFHYQNSYQYSNFNTDISVRKDIGAWQLMCGVNDLFNTSRSRWEREGNGVYFYKWLNVHDHGFYVRATYTFNPAKSKYKGGQAGQSEMNRL